MGRRKIEQHAVRSITRSGGGSFGITLPIEQVRSLGWKDRQRVTVRKVGKRLVIEDWGTNVDW
jgi:antitoxin component of MazEF toxin-antitoxin module